MRKRQTRFQAAAAFRVLNQEMDRQAAVRLDPAILMNFLAPGSSRSLSGNARQTPFAGSVSIDCLGQTSELLPIQDEQIIATLWSRLDMLGIVCRPTRVDQEPFDLLKFLFRYGYADDAKVYLNILVPSFKTMLSEPFSELLSLSNVQ